jgi:long-chain fatty acid transport protein
VSGTTLGISGANSDSPGDHMLDDALATLRTKDLFVPGVILSLHWSVLPQLDVAVWGRLMDSIKSSEGEFQTLTQIYGNEGKVNPVCYTDPAGCTTATPNNFPDPNVKPPNPQALTSFKFPIPPEVRLGLRFHQPRSKSVLAFDDGGEVRDPLHDDSFDVELDGSYTMNSKADVIEVRILEKDGSGALSTQPTGVNLPPNADRPTGYKDSYGIRLGGQWNAVQDKFAIRAGGWLETQSQDPAYLSINPVGATRWGFGGGIVFRQDFIDISFGYQRHLSAGLDNGGNGAQLTPVGTGAQPPFNLNTPQPGRQEFRSAHAINGGHVTQEAHAFTLGGTVRF